tara:strand:+ start:44 stop:859 length:816 start_codon:yes stop_codon:yes gene_type:complete
MLNLISTPIGNLDDISIRAIDVITSSDYIYAEDTRSFKKILESIKVKKPCRSFHEHNEDKVLNEIIKHVTNNKSIVLACEAGTPCISDPGFKLIRKFVELNLEYTLIPGPSSVTNALVLSGLPTDQFSFYGFVPRKQNAQNKSFENIMTESKTAIFFESIKRLRATIENLSNYIGNNRKISVCREMTKLHEQIITDTCLNILREIDNGNIPLKGEVVLVIEGTKKIMKGVSIDKKIKDEFLSKMSASDAAKLIALLTEQNKRDIYKILNKS